MSTFFLPHVLLPAKPSKSDMDDGGNLLMHGALIADLQFYLCVSSNQCSSRACWCMLAACHRDKGAETKGKRWHGRLDGRVAFLCPPDRRDLQRGVHSIAGISLHVGLLILAGAAATAACSGQRQTHTPSLAPSSLTPFFRILSAAIII